jgi:hypothetical protein
MFCPQCGQKQAASDVRFCSSCGFPLNVVTELLVNRGQLPWRPPAQPDAPLSPRQKGVRQGVMIMLSTLVIVPIVIFLGVAILGFHGALIPLAGALCIMGGLLRLLYAVFLEENAPPQLRAAEQYAAPPQMPPNYFGTPARGSALPPPQVPAPADYRPPRYDTGELATPRASVTDHTTRLLDRQPEEPPRQ